MVNGVANQAYTNYVAEIGYHDNSTFVATAHVAFGKTVIEPDIESLHLVALDPTTSGGSEYATFDIALSAARPWLTQILFNPSVLNLEVDDSGFVDVEPYPKYAAPNFTCSSQNESIARVDFGGCNVTAVAIGSTYIDVSNDMGVSNSFQVVVTYPVHYWSLDVQIERGLYSGNWPYSPILTAATRSDRPRTPRPAVPSPAARSRRTAMSIPEGAMPSSPSASPPTFWMATSGRPIPSTTPTDTYARAGLPRPPSRANPS